MIRIDFVEPDSQDWKAWRDECDVEQQTHNGQIQNGQPSKVDSKLYGKLKKEYFTKRDGVFHGKCAYCESRIRSSQHGDIEHFRPKAGITHRDNSNVKLTGGDAVHPGYYWLAYDWHNLLPSCVLCNQPNTEPDGVPLGKRNYFPLLDEKHRAEQPGAEAGEEPLLINPTQVDPAHHLGIDSTGVMFARDESSKGQMCIDVFGLNERELPTERKRVYTNTRRLWMDYVFKKLSDPASPSLNDDQVLLELIEAGNEAYTVAARLAIADAKAEMRAFVDSF